MHIIAGHWSFIQAMKPLKTFKALDIFRLQNQKRSYFTVPHTKKTQAHNKAKVLHGIQLNSRHHCSASFLEIIVLSFYHTITIGH
jgi:hypothetical protein